MNTKTPPSSSTSSMPPPPRGQISRGNSLSSSNPLPSPSSILSSAGPLPPRGSGSRSNSYSSSNPLPSLASITSSLSGAMGVTAISAPPARGQISRGNSYSRANSIQLGNNQFISPPDLSAIVGSSKDSLGDHNNHSSSGGQTHPTLTIHPSSYEQDDDLVIPSTSSSTRRRSLSASNKSGGATAALMAAAAAAPPPPPIQIPVKTSPSISSTKSTPTNARQQQQQALYQQQYHHHHHHQQQQHQQQPPQQIQSNPNSRPNSNNFSKNSNPNSNNNSFYYNHTQNSNQNYPQNYPPNAPPPVPHEEVVISEDILDSLYDNLDYNPQYDVYWDALEAPEEAFLKIVEPGSISFNPYPANYHQQTTNNNNAHPDAALPISNLPPPSYEANQFYQQHLPQQHQQQQQQHHYHHNSLHPSSLVPPLTSPQQSASSLPMYFPATQHQEDLINIQYPPQMKMNHLNIMQPPSTLLPQPNFGDFDTYTGNTPSSHRKHKRDEFSDGGIGGDDHQNGDHPGIDDDESEEGIKVMRFGSLGRIIASTVAASSLSDRKTSISERTPEQQEEYRKDLVIRIMKMLNQSNMNGLAKIIREKFHETCLLITPEVFDPISGKADIMILFSLLLESYPDSTWTTLNISMTQLDTISCFYLFKGTKLFSYPLNSLFRQIKSHIAKLPQNQVNDELSSAKLMNEVAEYCHVAPQPSLPSSSSNNPYGGGFEMGRNSSLRSSFSGDNEFAMGKSESDLIECEEKSINIPRRDQTLREVKSIESAVLKEGSMNYRRKVDFVFNEIDQIIRVVIINLIS